MTELAKRVVEHGHVLLATELTQLRDAARSAPPAAAQRPAPPPVSIPTTPMAAVAYAVGGPVQIDGRGHTYAGACALCSRNGVSALPHCGVLFPGSA